VKIPSPRVDIVLPEQYPQDSPQCTVLAPVFHPNIGEMVDLRAIWEATGDLCEVILYVGELLSFQKYELKDPLNAKAARWASKKADFFPVDPLPILPDEQWREREDLLARGEELLQQGSHRRALKEWESYPELADYPAIQQGMSIAREEINRQEAIIREAEEQLESGSLERALEILEPLEDVAGEEETFLAAMEKVRSAIRDRDEKRKEALALTEEGWALLEKGDLHRAEIILEKIEPVLSGEPEYGKLRESFEEARKEHEARHQTALQEMEKARDLFVKGKEEDALSLLESLTDGLGGDLAFDELLHSTRRQVEEKKKREAEALKEMEKAREMLLSGDPESALPLLETLEPVIGEHAEYLELLQAIQEGIEEREALRREIENTFEDAAAHLEAGLPENALNALSSIAPYCVEDERFNDLKSTAEQMRREQEFNLEIQRYKSSASRLFDTGHIPEALEEYKKLLAFARGDQEIQGEVEHTLEWRFEAKLNAARQRLRSMEVELAGTYLHYASLITPVASKRETELRSLRMEVELVERILSLKQEADRLKMEKKFEAAVQEWRKVLSIIPDNEEARLAISELRKLGHHRDVVNRASRIGLYVFLAVIAIAAAGSGYYLLERQSLRDAVALMEKMEYRVAVRKIEQASPPPLLTRARMNDLRKQALYIMHKEEGDRLAAAHQWEKALREYTQAIKDGGEREEIRQKIRAISLVQIEQAEEWGAQGRLDQADALLDAIIQGLAAGEELHSRAVRDRASVLLKAGEQHMKNGNWSRALQSVQALQQLDSQRPEAVTTVARFRKTVDDRIKDVERQINGIQHQRDRYAVETARINEQIAEDTQIAVDKEVDIKSLETRFPNEFRLSGELKTMEKEIEKLRVELNRHREAVRAVDEQIALRGENYLNSPEFQQYLEPAHEFNVQRARELFRLIQEKSELLRSTEESIKDFLQEHRRLQKALDEVRQEIADNKNRVSEMQKSLARGDSLEKSLQEEKDLVLDIEKQLAAEAQERS